MVNKSLFVIADASGDYLPVSPEKVCEGCKGSGKDGDRECWRCKGTGKEHYQAKDWGELLKKLQNSKNQLNVTSW